VTNLDHNLSWPGPGQPVVTNLDQVLCKLFHCAQQVFTLH
jgi:hypothetical protein